MAAGPGASALLADFGATVIKVETEKGDPWRKVLTRSGRSFGAVFEHDNRGKQSVVLDLTCKAGIRAFHLLLGTVDVLVCNVRVAGTQRLGLDYETLCKRYPRLIYAHITAFGREGPMTNAPGYDAGAFWASTGMLDNLRSLDNGRLPMLPGAAGDHATSLALVAGISLALYHREKTGEGKLVDVSLLRSGLWCNGMYLSAASDNNAVVDALKNPQRIGPTFQGYLTSDGQTIQLLGYQTGRHLPVLMRALGNLQKKPTVAQVGAIMQTKSAHEWEIIFDAEDVWYTRVMDLVDIASQAEIPNKKKKKTSGKMSQIPEQIYQTHGFYKGGRLTGTGAGLVASPMRLGSGLGGVNEPSMKIVPLCPELGEHTRSTLLSIGLSIEEISHLEKEGAFGSFGVGSEGKAKL